MSLRADVQLSRGALDLSVDIEVRPGEVLALLGPNGAGKSTLLRCLAGLIAVDAGRIIIDSNAVDDPATAAFVEPEDRSVGFVFQNYVLFEHMTVVENVAFGLRASGTPKAQALATARDWLKRVGLAGLAAARPKALSGGQAQRVALVRALATSPRVLLLDEPLAALDVGTRAQVRRDLHRHLESFEGMAIVVTHDPVDAYALADRVAILDAGRIVQIGTLAEVTARPRSRYVADLVGVNLVSGGVSEGVLATSSGARVVIADAPAGPSLAIIRPHSISLVRDHPEGSSARNVWAGTVAEIDRLGERARVSIDGLLPLTAEITVAALEAMQLRSGDVLFATVKATDIEVYPA